MIRELSKQMLENSGYSVGLANNGKQAIEKYQQSIKEGKPYDCIIMDLTIPGGKGGKEVIGEILKIPAGTVASRRNQAITRLRNKVNRQEQRA